MGLLYLCTIPKDTLFQFCAVNNNGVNYKNLKAIDSFRVVFYNSWCVLSFIQIDSCHMEDFSYNFYRDIHNRMHSRVNF